jgi:acetyl esterase/lipase
MTEEGIMKRMPAIVPALFLVTIGCGRSEQTPPSRGSSLQSTQIKQTPIAKVAKKAPGLAEARRGFKTKLIREETDGSAFPDPPPKLFERVHFDSPVGKLAAFLTPDPKDGKKRPAIIWITGGDCNTLDNGFWSRKSPLNDQTASGFREAGIIMMFPTLRGGNTNPGFREAFYGEVDDVLAAREYLSKLPFVDPQRIYLGGLSTGGTLVLLVAMSSDQFRAVFSFGPASDVSGYGKDLLTFDVTDQKEVRLRSPIHWLDSIRTPTFVLEGTEEPSNADDVIDMRAATTNPFLHFYPVTGAGHVTVLAPTARLIASKILRDEGAVSNIRLTEDEVNRLFAK